MIRKNPLKPKEKDFREFTMKTESHSFRLAFIERESGASGLQQIDNALNDKFDALILPAEAVPYPLPEETEIAALIKTSFFGDSFSGLSVGVNDQVVLLIKRGRDDVKAAFYEHDIRRNYGKVWLVGAGPGNPELMTIKADKVLSEADIIFYDDLVDKDYIRKYSAELVYVGKRKGKHSKRQEEINRMLYSAALQGKNIARLKGGDPLIFARAGEELEYLQKRFVSVEIVPGITAAQACAASYNIPFTKRGVSGSVSLASAHYSLSRENPGKLCDTQIYYMAASKLAELSDKLISQGLNPETPVAVIHKGSFYDEKCVGTTLNKMPGVALPSPVTVIIGGVVNDKYEADKILFTGIDPAEVRLNAKIVHYPLIAIQPNDYAPLNMQEFDGLVFTDKHSVKIFCERYETSGQTIISFRKSAEKELLKAGLTPHLKPEDLSCDKLTNIMAEYGLRRVLFLQPAVFGNEDYSLKGVYPLSLYRIVAKKQPGIDLSPFSGIVFTNELAVDEFRKIYGNFPERTLLMCADEKSEEKLLSLNADPDYLKKVALI
ncbi:MAG: uroporphyrinogen-III C-methyltransferase [Calditrichaeota bacterium]|nr:uroporphyrinogen-III C-methyltransferase [Calditrichota bacterium]